MIMVHDLCVIYINHMMANENCTISGITSALTKQTLTHGKNNSHDIIRCP